MSEMGNADLFKSRLAQLKKVLERDARIAENLFYAALQLDKNKELKSGVYELIEKHRMKVKKGYLYLPDDEKDRPAAVKALLKDAFDFLLKAFNIDKAHSSAEFKIRHMVGNVTGKFTDFSGVVNVDRANPGNSTVEFTIQTASMTSGAFSPAATVAGTMKMPEPIMVPTTMPTMLPTPRTRRRDAGACPPGPA